MAAVLALGVAAGAAPQDSAGVTSDTSVATDTGVTADTEVTTASNLPAPPAVSAQAWAVYDGVDGTRLAGVAPADARPIASLTKVMTALVVTKRTAGDEQVRVSKGALAVGDGAAMGLKAGERYELDALLQAMLVYSANDAANALAEYVGDDTAGFVKMMNDEAEALGLRSSTFTSPTGLDPERGSEATESSPADLFELAQIAMKEPRIREAVRLEQAEVKRRGAEPIVVGNRNPLVGTYAGVDGIKTGHTNAAGYCLLTHYDDAENRELYVVVLGAKSEAARAADTRALLDWAVPLRQNVEIAAAGDVLGTAPVSGSRDQVQLFLSEDVRVSVRAGESVTERYVLPVPVKPPLREGDEIGTFQLVVDGEVAASSPVYVDRSIREPSQWERIETAARDWRGAVAAGRSSVERGSKRLRQGLGV